MEIKMAVFDGRHFDIGILVDHAGADVATEKHLSNWDCPASIADPDLRTLGEILHGCLDQSIRPGRSIDVDRFCAILKPRHRQQCTKTCRVIIVMVGEENSSDVPTVDTGLRKTICDAIASVNDIMCSVDG